jgi:HPr kinase/phosphorylase
VGSSTIHGSAVLVGARAVLIRGPSGAGKSRLVLRLLDAARSNQTFFARLVGDDRVYLNVAHGRVLVRPADALAGKLEVRGIGVLRFPYEPVAVLGSVLDLGDPDATRLPEGADTEVEIQGVILPRLALPACADALGVLLASLREGVPAEAAPALR